MKKFSYTVINVNGNKIKGSIDARDINEAKSKLKSKKFKIIELKEKRQSELFSLAKNKKELKISTISHFCKQFAIIISSGVNNITGLEGIAKKTEDKLLAEEINRISEDIKNGFTISEAMLKDESKMPKLLGAMVLIGEETGTLDEVLKSMSSFYERENKINQRIKSASTYPIIVGILSLVLLFIFTTFIIPKMMETILSVGGELPLITKIVVAVGNFMSSYWWLIIIIGYAISYFIVKYIKTPLGREMKDRTLNNAPLLGKGIRSIVSMRFSRTLYLFISTGYPITQGLEHIKSTLNNSLAEKSIEEAKEGLIRGETLADSLEKTKYFDSILIQMIDIGEKTGQLETISNQMAEFYEYESDTYLTRLISMIEPVLIIVVGIIVAILVIALFLPMLSVYDSL